MRASIFFGLLSLAACGDSKPVATTPAGDTNEPPAVPPPQASLVAVQQGQCGACHALPESLAGELPPKPALPVVELASFMGPKQVEATLADHFGGAHASDLTAWLQSLQPAQAPREAKEISGGAIEVGGQLVKQLACAACHTEEDLDLAAIMDHAQLAALLRAPGKHVSGLQHIALTGTEADAVAAYLLRAQKQEGLRSEGFGYVYYEQKIPDGNWPDFTGVEPTGRGIAKVLDTAVAKRKHNYAIEFSATIEVPAAGEWRFATRSDDGSWLWLDGKLVVDNPGMKPTTRKNGVATLSKGAHELRVAYTQGGGGAKLEVLWAGPGLDEQVLPASVATTSVAKLVPPPVADIQLDADAIKRGREAARAARCDACHAVADPEFDKLAAPAAAKEWAALGTGECSAVPGARCDGPLQQLSESVEVATRVRIAMHNDGCLQCHTRDGVGGLAKDVKDNLHEIEDIGEEGMVPPDLTMVGRRLRPEWLLKVIAKGHKSRDYVAMRMPAYGEERARQYVEWFGELDAKDVVDEEPPFSEEAVELGRALAGTGGRNCISCHRMSGKASLGPQGMDLAKQHERLRPGWFRDWLLRPTTLRPNTRMPSLWLTGSEQDTKDVDAIRTWLALGESAPLPKGVVVDSKSLVLEPVDRPILHGAFLKDVSARTLAVGTPARTHFAYDLVKPRLVWLWRGAFMDARGTWHGRAGQLISPLGKDWQVVDDFAIVGEGEDNKRKLLGQRRTKDGYPVIRVKCGDASYEDQAVPRLSASGSELIRTIRCTEGTLEIEFPSTDKYEATSQGKPVAQHKLAAGQSLEVVYQW